MLEVKTITWSWPLRSVRKTQVWFVPDRAPCPLIEHEVTDEERARCPKRFRCFSCQRMLKETAFGGILDDQYICLSCRPYLDEWSVGGMIKLDLRGGLQVTGWALGKSRPRREPPEETTEAYLRLYWQSRNRISESEREKLRREARRRSWKG